jgi:hypothetical protein
LLQSTQHNTTNFITTDDLGTEDLTTDDLTTDNLTTDCIDTDYTTIDDSTPDYTTNLHNLRHGEHQEDQRHRCLTNQQEKQARVKSPREQGIFHGGYECRVYGVFYGSIHVFGILFSSS